MNDEGIDDPIPSVATYGGLAFAAIALAGAIVGLNRAEWSSGAARERAKALAEASAEQQRKAAETAQALATLRQECEAEFVELQRQELESYRGYLREPPMDCERRRGAWALRSPSSDRALSALHTRYQRLRDRCAQATSFSETLNGRSLEEAEYISCYGRPIPMDPPAPPIAPPTIPLTEPPPFVAPPEYIRNPRWIERPNGQDFADLYPRRAAAADQEGRVVLDCAVADDGRIACFVASEAPEGWGFGEASLRASRRFRMVPAVDHNGQFVNGARVRVTLRWELAN